MVITLLATSVLNGTPAVRLGYTPTTQALQFQPQFPWRQGELGIRTLAVLGIGSVARESSCPTQLRPGVPSPIHTATESRPPSRNTNAGQSSCKICRQNFIFFHVTETVPSFTILIAARP